MDEEVLQLLELLYPIIRNIRVELCNLNRFGAFDFLNFLADQIQILSLRHDCSYRFSKLYADFGLRFTNLKKIFLTGPLIEQVLIFRLI